MITSTNTSFVYLYVLSEDAITPPYVGKTELQNASQKQMGELSWHLQKVGLIIQTLTKKREEWAYSTESPFYNQEDFMYAGTMTAFPGGIGSSTNTKWSLSAEIDFGSIVTSENLSQTSSQPSLYSALESSDGISSYMSSSESAENSPAASEMLAEPTEVKISHANVDNKADNTFPPIKMGASDCVVGLSQLSQDKPGTLPFR